MKALPSKAELLDYIRDNPGKSGKRDIARAFGIKGAARVDLKHMLRDLQRDGDISRKKGGFRGKGELPPVAVLSVERLDSDGDVWASPIAWDEGEGDAPQIRIPPHPKAPAPGKGDRILTRITRHEDDTLTGKVIRKIGTGPQTILGLYRQTDEGGRIVSVSKKSDKEWIVSRSDTGDAKDGELVEVERLSKDRSGYGLPKARVVARLGDPMAPKAISLIAIHEHDIPNIFPDAALEEAASAKPAPLGQREDLRHLPLFTIDPADARDHDDAICAVPDTDPKNEGGYIVYVAIADVAYYVRPGSELDQEARHRGNSSYFPDRVVPMLPEALSGDLCSLHEGVDRPCIAAVIQLDPHGRKLSHRFTRAMMQSPASLSYEQAQAAADGHPDDQTKPLVQDGIIPLWNAYAAALEERKRRQPLNLDLPERKIVLSETGQVTSVQFRERFDAHKLVEKFMILANVCAAETLEAKKRSFLYRVHEEPSPEKLDALRKTADSIGLTLAKGQVLQTKHLNQLLNAAEGRDDAEAINISVLRSMTQAYYAPSNFAHFGLNLKKYAHFTSPIRRYADLIVHRALIAAHGWGDDGITTQDEDRLEETGELISQTERRSMLAERDTNDRYLSAYLSDRVGNEFEGRVSGVASFGLFVKLDETGADGIVPVSTIGNEYFHFDKEAQTLTGDTTRLTLGLGTRVTVRLVDAVAVTGGLTLELLSHEGRKLPQSPRRAGKKRGPRRALNKSKKRQSRKKR